MIKLTPDQKEAVKQLKEKRKALLTNSCNGGKTIISLSVAKDLNVKTLIICQKAKMEDWLEEARALGNPLDKLTIVNYEKAHLIKEHFRLVIVDESHNMGDYSTRKGKAIIGHCKKASHNIFVSATPMKGKPTDLYWPLKLCGVYTSTKDSFRIAFCGAYYPQGGRGLWDGKASNLEVLEALLREAEVFTSYNIRKLKVHKTYINFPVGIDERKVTKTDKHGRSRKVFNVPEFEETSRARLEMAEKKLEAFRAYTYLGKLEKRAVIFTHHRFLTEEAAKLLGCPKIMGGISHKQRRKDLKRFNHKEIDYIVISLKSGSEGINIFGCNTCYFLELDFSPMTYKQAYQRLARTMEDTELKAFFFRGINEHADILEEKKKDLFKSMGY